MKFNKVLALLLSVLFVLSAMMVSCQDAPDDVIDGTKADTKKNNNDTEGTQGPEDKPANDQDEIPEMSFDGEEIALLTFNTDYIDANHVFDEPSDDPVNFAKYRTITALESRFTVDINEYIQSYDYVNVTYRNMIQAGADDYDIVFADDLHAHYFAEEGEIYDYDELTYIDLGKDYWDQSLLEYTRVGDRVYYACGTLDFTYFDLTHCLTYNKDLSKQLGCEDPYTLVANNNWTIDKMFEMMQKATFDVNGDEMYTNADSYGYISSSKQILPDFWIAAGITTVSLDEDNLPYLNIQGNERLYDVIDKCFSYFWDGGVWYVSTSPQGNQSDSHEIIFESSRALFADYTFHYLSQLRDCEADFGILPFPKFTKDQDKYYSRVEAGCCVALVPISNPDPDNAGVIIEAMASTGYKEILPAYYESALKRKVSRDEESQVMLDLIFNSRVYDLGDTWFCGNVRDGMMRLLFNCGENRLSSYYKMYEKPTIKEIEATIEAYTR